MSGQVQVGIPFVQLMQRYRAIAPRPHVKPLKTADSSKTPQGSGSSCSGRETPSISGGVERPRTGLKRGAEQEAQPAKRVKQESQGGLPSSPFELPTAVSLPMTQQSRPAAGPVETKTERYGFNSQAPLPFPRTPLYPPRAPFVPAPYPTSSLNRYQGRITGPSFSDQHFPSYSPISRGTVLGVPVNRSSLLEQVVPANYFPSHQQLSSSGPSEGVVTSGGFTTPPLLVVSSQPPPAKSKGDKEKGSAKLRMPVPIAPKSDAPPTVALPFGGLHAGPRSGGGFQYFGTLSVPQKGGFVAGGPPRVPAGASGKVVRAWPVKQEPISLALPFKQSTGESPPLGGNGSGFRQFCRAEVKPCPARELSGGEVAASSQSARLSHEIATLDSHYLEQLYGAFVEPIMVTDLWHQLLWSNAAFQKAAEQSQAGEGRKEETDQKGGEDEAKTDPSRGSEAVPSREPQTKSGLTTEGSEQRGERPVGEGMASAARIPSNSAIPIPISSIQFQGHLQPASCSAILWAFLKSPGLLTPAGSPPPRSDPPTPLETPDTQTKADDPSSPLNSPSDVLSVWDDSSAGSSSSTGSLATATSHEPAVLSRNQSPGKENPPTREVTPQVGSTVRFEGILPITSDPSLAVKGSFEHLKRQFDQWSSPVVLTDLKNRARWVNVAYKKLVGISPPGQRHVTGGISILGLETLKTLPASLKCTAKVSCWPSEGLSQPLESCCIGTRIDSVGSEVLGYLWRFGFPWGQDRHRGLGENAQGKSNS